MKFIEPDKRSFLDLSNLENEISPNTNRLLRGGFPEIKSTNSKDGDLLNKLEHYREKILSDTHNNEDELNLHIETLITAEDHDSPEIKDDNDKSKENNKHLMLDAKPLDSLKDFRKHFLITDETKKSQVLLLTGQAGSGKSLFCRLLQRDLLSTWSSSPTQEVDQNLPFPIYIDCSLMMEFEVDAIAKILQNELSLTEEATKALQSSESSTFAQPNPLIIFDGCDTAVQKLLEEFLISELDHDKCNISHIIGTEKFKTVKILITCREESLQGIKNRELLFAPINYEESLHGSSNSPKSFLQRRIELFSDEQITRYLIKCCFYGILEASNETVIQQSKKVAGSSELPSNFLSSLSWVTVKNFESMIDSYGLREMARTPFMLKVIVEVLPGIVTESISEQKLLQAKTLTAYHFIEQFIDRAIQLNTQLRLAALTKAKSDGVANELEKAEAIKCFTIEIRQQLQSLALKLSGYSSKSSISLTPEINVERSVLESNSLLEWNESNSSLRFRDSLVMKYLVAEQIREELVQLTAASLTKEKIMIQKEILLNQHLLNLRTPQNLTIQILCDAVKKEKISTELLFNIIDLSRQRQKNSESPLQMRAEEEELQMKDEKQEESEHEIVETAPQRPNQLTTKKRVSTIMLLKKTTYTQTLK